ncbi:MarR family winged helix-turn-helix transcriptional regulator [Clostridioides difficile]|uniref:MarR family winged helix-turn-helix transcriptional regulator n=1 Tax=Clostridioides difficile TaxID=1496 RepID=UPI000BB18E79|nr:MarR family winged helix-turn-helix transcriptional regulator [Clostridioides difficile]MBY2210194.1 MarR family winged helix-turn-helix transcriptional regulator [Clostridioides difficile]MBY2428259.1 MarR family winged helix-turn-helix transcriptional regulator [Clostridioides difficile]MBZ0593922.1 MarR family winged helix-turn-helix transcriptional regulator [Clostridioides difficile]MBZ0872511.1 MarR family winged helix-turn-helix transcriptional regulator [Clostridioides difficile]MCI
MNPVKELNNLWHIVSMQMKTEMCSGKYPTIHGISLVELSILEIVEQYPNSMMKEISEILELPKSTLTSAVKRLELKKFIKKNPCIKDKRGYNLVLTELGLKAQQEHRNIEIIVFRNLFHQLDKDEIETFIRIFSKAVNKSKK